MGKARRTGRPGRAERTPAAIPTRQWLRPKDISTRYGLSRRGAYGWINQAEADGGRVIRMRNYVAVHAADLEAFIKRYTANAG